MSRLNLPAGFNTVVGGPHFDWFALIELQLASATLRLCSLDFNVEWDGHSWLGLRGAGSIEPIEETPGDVTGMLFTLRGVQESEIAAVLAEPVQGRTAIIRFAVLDKSTEPPSLVVDPNVWQGLLDVQRFKEAGGIVSVSAENRLVEWDRPRLLRFTHEDHQRLHPGDNFFKFVPQMVERSIIIFSKEALARRV